jgi:hypothetical protein
VASSIKYKIEKPKDGVFRIVRHIAMNDVLWQGRATRADAQRLVRQTKDWKNGTVIPDASTVQRIAERLGIGGIKEELERQG